MLCAGLGLAGIEQHGQCGLIRVVPVVVRHRQAVRAKPEQIWHGLRVMARAAIEKALGAQTRQRRPQSGERGDQRPQVGIGQQPGGLLE